MPSASDARRDETIAHTLREGQDAPAAWFIRATLSPGEIAARDLGERAIDGACPQALRALLERGLADGPSGSFHGTLLHHAVLKRENECVRALIEHGFDVEAADALRRRPLHLAVEARNLAAIALLLGAGADPDARDHHDRTPLSVIGHVRTASQRRCKEMIEGALRHRALRTPSGCAPDPEDEAPGL